MRHPNDPGWAKQRADLRNLALDLLKHGPVTDAAILESILLTAHLSGQQFAFDTMRDSFQKTLYPAPLQRKC